MLFNSYIFIFAFLPVCLLGFYGLGTKWPSLAKAWLILMSLWFYGYFNVSYLLIMLFSIVFNYGVFKWILKKKESKIPLIFGIVGNLSVLFYFKYFDFFLENCNKILGMSVPLRNILLPLGISFFTFQQIGFIADTYRGEIKECSPLDYALFVSFFPQLIAGPIVNHDEMLPQFAAIGTKRPDADRFAKGIYIFVIGMAKKVLVADTFGRAVDFGWSSLLSINATEALIVMFSYALQLYFDFSGYCDMAIGLSSLLGIKLPINFNSPYKARNIVEFWKRWHITLSRFFTKNIYIPLGGNRKGELRTYCNIFIVFLISGIWHGAGYTFILWGVMHGALHILTKIYEKIVKRRAKGNMLLMYLFVSIAWVVFRAPGISELKEYLLVFANTSFTLPSVEFAECFREIEFWYVLKMLHLADTSFGPYILMVLYMIIGHLVVFFAPNVHEMEEKCRYKTITGVVLGFVFAWCVISLSGVSTFLYFNF